MYTSFHINVNELDNNFLKALKVLFGNKSVSITVEEEQDEAEYLLQSEANRRMLYKSMKQAENGELLTVNIGKTVKK